MRVKQGALFRDGRFDGVVFFDLPGHEAKDGMWQLHRDTYGIPKAEPDPPDEGWAPGNVEVYCQRAVQFSLPLAEAARYVRPSQDPCRRVSQPFFAARLRSAWD